MKRNLTKHSIEKHDTASLTDIHKTKKGSNVSSPSLEQVTNAKEYVDENQK